MKQNLTYFNHKNQIRYVVKRFKPRFQAYYLLGALKLTKDADPDKFGYSSYGIGFDVLSKFLLSSGD